MQPLHVASPLASAHYSRGLKSDDASGSFVCTPLGMHDSCKQLSPAPVACRRPQHSRMAQQSTDSTCRRKRQQRLRRGLSSDGSAASHRAAKPDNARLDCEAGPVSYLEHKHASCPQVPLGPACSCLPVHLQQNQVQSLAGYCPFRGPVWSCGPLCPETSICAELASSRHRAKRQRRRVESAQRLPERVTRQAQFTCTNGVTGPRAPAVAHTPVCPSHSLLSPVSGVRTGLISSGGSA